MAARLTILTTEIRQHDGLYSLNDLHKAAGGKDKHRPNQFLRLDQTQALIAEIKHCADLRSADTQGLEMSIAERTINGGPQRGTYVCRELVYAYAMWISPKFHLQVIRAFDAQQSTPDHSAQLAEIERIFKQQYLELRKQYNYPCSLLDQPYFVSRDNPARLDINMLANTRRFISPLFGLLNELRADGHDVTAPLAEAEAMREGLIKADDAFNQIWEIALRTQNRPASASLRKK